MRAIDWPRLYSKHDLGNFVEQLREDWKANLDFVLIDSRTGFTDVMGVSTIQLPDLIVLMFTANAQSLYGALNAFESSRNTRRTLPFDRSKLLALPVISRYEARIEYRLAQEWLDLFAKVLAPLLAEWLPQGVTPSELLNFARLPYIPYWSFGEKLPVIEKGTRDPEDIGYAIETLSALLANRLASSDLLVRNRDSYVESAKKLKGKEGRAPNVFISYSHKDKVFFDELQLHLSILLRQGVIGAAWHDGRISAGEKSIGHVAENLDDADIIILLISPDYLASDYCYDVEMARALERFRAGSASVVPILLRAVDWRGTPLKDLQALPRGGKAIASWSNSDQAWAETIRELRLRIESPNPG
jgi:hypothetical protein